MIVEGTKYSINTYERSIVTCVAFVGASQLQSGQCMLSYYDMTSILLILYFCCTVYCAFHAQSREYLTEACKRGGFAPPRAALCSALQQVLRIHRHHVPRTWYRKLKYSCTKVVRDWPSGVQAGTGHSSKGIICKDVQPRTFMRTPFCTGCVCSLSFHSYRPRTPQKSSNLVRQNSQGSYGQCGIEIVFLELSKPRVPCFPVLVLLLTPCACLASSRRGQVRLEDQRSINEFGRLNTRLTEIKDDKSHIKVRRKIRKNFEEEKNQLR